MSWLSGSEQDRPWFHVRSYGVGTSELVVGVSLVVMLISVAAPTLLLPLVMMPHEVLAGYVWQVVTWPLANWFGFWSIWSAFVFWSIGRYLERELGKGRFGWMLLGMTLVASLIALLLTLAWPSGGLLLAGLGVLSSALVLIYIAENPHARSFFGIQAWIIGLVLIGITVLTYVGYRDWVGLLHLALTYIAAAVVAKYAGLLERYAFVPGHAYTPGKRQRRPKKAAPRKGAAPRPTPGASNVVKGPWLGPEPPAREDEEMDALLDKIMDRGLESLTSKERKRLEELRQQRRAR